MYDSFICSGWSPVLTLLSKETEKNCTTWRLLMMQRADWAVTQRKYSRWSELSVSFSLHQMDIHWLLPSGTWSSFDSEVAPSSDIFHCDLTQWQTVKRESGPWRYLLEENSSEALELGSIRWYGKLHRKLNHCYSDIKQWQVFLFHVSM